MSGLLPSRYKLQRLTLHWTPAVHCNLVKLFLGLAEIPLLYPRAPSAPKAKQIVIPSVVRGPPVNVWISGLVRPAER